MFAKKRTGGAAASGKNKQAKHTGPAAARASKSVDVQDGKSRFMQKAPAVLLSGPLIVVWFCGYRRQREPSPTAAIAIDGSHSWRALRGAGAQEKSGAGPALRLRVGPQVVHRPLLQELLRAEPDRETHATEAGQDRRRASRVGRRHTSSLLESFCCEVSTPALLHSRL